jgi:hypothetical protein
LITPVALIVAAWLSSFAVVVFSVSVAVFIASAPEASHAFRTINASSTNAFLIGKIVGCWAADFIWIMVPKLCNGFVTDVKPYVSL